MHGLGYQVAPADVGNALSYLHGIGLIEGATPSRKPELAVRPEAIVARTPRGDLGYLLSADEADLLVSCRGGCTISELHGDPDWVSRVLAKACGLGLLVATRPSQAHVAPVRPTPTPRPTPVPRQPQLPATPPPAPAPALDPDFDNQTFVETEETQVGPPPEEITPTGAGEVVARRSQPIIAPDPNRLAQLAGLSLPKDNLASLKPASRAPSNKLPWILLAVVVIGGGYYHYTTVRDRPVAAATGTVQQASGAESPQPRTHHALLASGYIAAKAPIVLSATSSGRLEKMNVDNGDRITKGQLLAVVADGQVRAELSLAHARIRDAKRQLKRTRTLVKAQAATPSDLERAVGAVEIAQAEARVIAQRLEETKIKSPIDGTVLEVLVHPGEAITGGPDKGAGVLRIADLSELIAEVNVGETELKQVFVGQDCEIVSEAQRDKPHQGKVREIAEQADRARGTVLVKVDIEPTPDSVLKPGMAVQVRFKPPAAPAPAP
jgi:RND family efflux transporter MFP subunit